MKFFQTHSWPMEGLTGTYWREVGISPSPRVSLFLHRMQKKTALNKQEASPETENKLSFEPMLLIFSFNIHSKR